MATYRKQNGKQEIQLVKKPSQDSSPKLQNTSIMFLIQIIVKKGKSLAMTTAIAGLSCHSTSLATVAAVAMAANSEQVLKCESINDVFYTNLTFCIEISWEAA